MTSIEILNTRLFPKHLGADQYRLTGIASRCDWVFLSDTREPRVHLVKRVLAEAHPQTIFLSLRSPEIALERFVTDVLPELARPFVLISGSEDATLPRQVDLRWPEFGPRQHDAIDAIRCHPMLVHWWAENLDTPGDARRSPLPLGLVFDGDARPVQPTFFASLNSRPLTALCAHRVRDGDQWEVRRSVTRTARQHWSRWAHVPDQEMPESSFMQLLHQHSFVLCVEGGGLDPSPKAWLSLLNGAIPIIRRNPTTAGYSGLPILYVDDWQPHTLDAALLHSAREQIIKRFQSAPDWRERWLTPLTLDYWWERICSPLSDTANRAY